MKTVRHYGIEHHISEPNMHNQNPVEGVIREIRKKWYRTMIRRRVPRQLWDYGMVWCSEIMSMTYSSAGELTGSIPLEKVTGETPDISMPQPARWRMLVVGGDAGNTQQVAVR